MQNTTELSSRLPKLHISRLFTNKQRVNIAFVGLLAIIAGAAAFFFAPERTQDGLVHLYWNSFWTAQVLSGDWFPQWHAQGYGAWAMQLSSFIHRSLDMWPFPSLHQGYPL